MFLFGRSPQNFVLLHEFAEQTRAAGLFGVTLSLHSYATLRNGSAGATIPNVRSRCSLPSFCNAKTSGRFIKKITMEVLQKNVYSNFMQSTAHPFVKWAGGKTQLLPEIRKHYPQAVTKYCEPFVGGGAVLFDVLQKCHPEEVLIL